MAGEDDAADLGAGLLAGEARMQRLLAGSMLGIGTVVCAAFSVFDLLVTGYLLDAAAEAAGVVIYLFALGAVVRGRHLRAALHALVLTTTALVLIAVGNGQIDHAVLVWPLIVPPLALLMIGLRQGWPYVAVTLFGSGAATLLADPLPDVVLLANFLAAFAVITLLATYIAVSRDMAIHSLRRAAETDFLTGVLNRRSFQARYDRLRTQAEAEGRPLALLVLDADRFKAINDSHGHDAGDRAVTHLARLIGGGLRPGDVLGRIGGEEFAVVLPDCASPEAVLLAEGLREAVAARPLVLETGADLRLTVSIGVALAQPEDSGFAGHFARADGRLFAAKAAGRNRVVADDRVIDGVGASS